jgi:hypothetical protein
MPTYPMALGGGRGDMDCANKIPYGWLIGVDGKVVWQGNPGSLSKKDIEAELKKIAKPTDEVKEARAAAILAYAETLIEKKRYLLAVEMLQKAAKKYSGVASAKAADDRIKALEAVPETKADLDAQKALVKITGGLECPKEKMKGKEMDGAATKLESFLKKNEATAPGAAEIAKEWAGALSAGGK